MMKIYVVELNGKKIRTIRTPNPIKVGMNLPDEVWFGSKISGGIVTKILCKK